MMNNSYYYPCLCNQRKGKLKVSGSGSVKAMPDIAVISLGVVTENPSSRTAQEENAMKANSVINSLYQSGVTKKQIGTKSYTIEPVYDYVDGTQVFKYYRVTNILSVTLTNLMEIGKIIDAATSSGANRVDSVNFSVADTSEYYDKALNMAIKDGVRKAYNIANSIGAQLHETPCSITEESQAVPYEENAMPKLYAASTPIVPGQIIITARIEAVFLYR